MPLDASAITAGAFFHAERPIFARTTGFVRRKRTGRPEFPAFGKVGCYLKCRRTAEIRTGVSELTIRYISEFHDIGIGEPGKIVRT